MLLPILLFLSVRVYAAPEDLNEESGEEEEIVIKPTLNAAVSEKALTINAESEKGIRAIYINGYKFTNTGNGNLKIKLTQFDAGYQKFYIYAEDADGIASELYEVENPYFDTDPKDDKNPADELPIDASATDPTEAVGTISEHLFNGGREFYTIETINGKTFYLVVDMLSDEEKVYFLTEISERDLMNATSDQSETLPRNSAIPEEGIPEGVVTNNNASQSTIETIFGKEEEAPSEVPEKKLFGFKDNNNTTKEGEESMQPSTMSNLIIYGGMAVIAVIIIVVVMAIKKKKRKNADYDDYEEIKSEDKA